MKSHLDSTFGLMAHPGKPVPGSATTASSALRLYWREYLAEALCLGLFMISACVFAVLLEHPMSPVHQGIEDSFVRRVLMGIAMGLTAILIICSPWGQRSGAHMNPAVTLAFWTLGKIQPWVAIFYVGAQFAGGAAGVQVSQTLLGPLLEHSAINYVATQPGPQGAGAAFVAELLISCLLLGAVLICSNVSKLAWSTPFVAGALVALYITFEAPLSGMSMNPARSWASAVYAADSKDLWVYFAAPALGMLLAAHVYRLRMGIHRVFCAKLLHPEGRRCVFNCNYGALYGNQRSL